MSCEVRVLELGFSYALWRNLLETLRELEKKTGHGVLFTKRLGDFILRGPEVCLHEPRPLKRILSLRNPEVLEKRAHFSMKSLAKLGYQAWVGLNLILLLEPNEFLRVDENHRIVRCAKNLALCRRGMLKEGLGLSPNFIFFSNLLNSWIGFGFEPSPSPESLRPDTWLVKGEKPEDLRFLVNIRDLGKHVLIDAKEEEGWHLRRRKGKTEIEILEDYVKEYEPKALYVVCYKKEEGLTIHSPKIKIIDSGFNREKLKPIVEELKNM